MGNFRRRMIEAVAREVSEKGFSFTMSDLSGRMGVSKKTLYEFISSKEDVINSLIDELRESIKFEQNRILAEGQMDVIEKIRSLLTVVPELHYAFNYRRLVELRKKYPEIYQRVVDLFDKDWEPTFGLMKIAMEQNRMKTINLTLFKMLYFNAVTGAYTEEALAELDLTYRQSLEGIVEILLDGIVIKRG